MKMLIRWSWYVLYGIGLSILLTRCGQTAVPKRDQSTAITTNQPGIIGSDQPSQVVSHGGSVKDQVSFIDQLRSKGMTVDIVGQVEQPFLKVKGTTLRISGGMLKQPVEVQTYNYTDEDVNGNGVQAAEADSQQIGPDGNPLTMNILWSAPPHWFYKDQLIVFYSGTDQETLDLLGDLVGPQFAGQ